MPENDRFGSHGRLSESVQGASDCETLKPKVHRHLPQFDNFGLLRGALAGELDTSEDSGCIASSSCNMPGSSHSFRKPNCRLSFESETPLAQLAASKDEVLSP